MGCWCGSFVTVGRTTWFGVLCVAALLDIVLPSPQRPTKLVQTATEILYIEDGYPEHRTYKLEDFFWTGSGDGAPENPWDESDKMSTIYKTKTVMSTIYISVNDNNQTNTEIQTPSECVIDCETVSTPEGEIRPTPTYENHTTSPSIPDHGEKGNATTDRHFWLLTVIKTDGQEPMVAVLEKRLAKLYSVAFRRQQERHLGIAKRPKRDLNNNKNLPENKPVNVCIHTIAKNEDTNEVEVLYHVLVSGKPVAAVTAASDMRFVSDEEVANELGFPIRTKAEPYLKMERSQSLARVRDTWIFVGVALATIFLLLFMVTLFTLCLNKKKRTNLPVRPIGISNRQHIFEREGGQDNNGFVDGVGDNTKSYTSGRRYHRGTPHRKNTASNESLTSRLPLSRPQSSQSSITTTSSSSSDASPLMLPPKHKTHSQSRIQKKLRQNDKRVAAINKTLLLQKHASIGVESDSSIDKHGSETTLVKDSESRGKISPKSYLSMPSVKSFPKSSIPETLNKVLEPVSVLHLDMTDDVGPDPSPIMYRPISGKKFTRHGSMGCEDPGVIGPVVWDLHCKRLKNDKDDDPKGDNHANRMRRRFNELLDDTFSLFGTSKETTEPSAYAASTTSAKSGERGHSAIVSQYMFRPSTGNSPVPKPRPKTSDPRRVAPSPGLEPPRGAWASTTPSPLIRPLSAGPFHKPSIEMERILADGTLPATDPAVPLIAAIKTELEKCSLPGSTTNLADK